MRCERWNSSPFLLPARYSCINDPLRKYKKLILSTCLECLLCIARENVFDLLRGFGGSFIHDHLSGIEHARRGEMLPENQAIRYHIPRAENVYPIVRFALVLFQNFKAMLSKPWLILLPRNWSNVHFSH